ncbi:MAG: single-stranded DNA-binding protein [Candidatus Omnitrophica bacterium]|nr:single-stranded DNA-binding protein [Candidatus Omnitrophota bacterium]
MAASFNKVLLLGNLTRDPELRYLPSGQPVTSFSIAVNRAYTAQTGEKKEEVSFVRIVVWARLAEICNEYLKKGSPVFVEGRLQSRSWDAPDGTKRSTMEVVAQSVQFLNRSGGRSTESSGAGEFAQEAPETAAYEEGEGHSAAPRAKKSLTVSSHELEPDDEIPF